MLELPCGSDAVLFSGASAADADAASSAAIRRKSNCFQSVSGFHRALCHAGITLSAFRIKPQTLP